MAPDRPCRIIPDPPRPLAAMAEATVLSAAVRAGSAPPAMRQRLAALLNQLDRHAEAIALFDGLPATTLAPRDLLLRSTARFETGDAAGARADAERALASATSDADRVRALADGARACFRLGETAAACAALDAALALDPADAEACKRLAMHYFRIGDDAAIAALIARLRDQGVNHTELRAVQALALARAGDAAAARALLGLDPFLIQHPLPPPPGWPDLAAFNRALADELLASPALRYGRRGTSSVDSWRIDALGAGGGPVVASLIASLVDAAQTAIAALPDADHPWCAARPATARLSSWCVITDAAGHEDWHMHQHGWMSGVYYVAVPDAVAAGQGDAGCLALGLPDQFLAQPQIHRRIRPAPGLLALFPSHCFHRSFPHGAAGKRICVAFDISG